MPKNYAGSSFTEMRRKDRAVEDETWIKEFLCDSTVGILATGHNGQPFINTNLFVYDEARHCVYMHTARTGRARANAEENERVCFSVFEMGRLLPADVALEFSVEYASVIIFGVIRILEEQDEARYALQALLNKYAPHLTAGKDYRPPVPEELKRTSVFRIDIEDWSAKKKEVEPDFPGAYWREEKPALASARNRLLTD